MNLRACILTVTLATLMLLAPCLAGEFGQTRQYFAQYAIGGPAETSFDVHNPGEAVIVVEVELFNSDGSPDQSDLMAVVAGGTDSLVFSDPQGEVRNGWARLTSDDPFNATVFFSIAGVGNLGVLPSEQGVKFKLFAFVGVGTDTAYAVANTSETQSSTVTMRFFNTGGEFQKEVEKTYGPGEHEAVFVTQEPLSVQKDGLVEFMATQPVIILSLRTDNNLLSSTAVIRPEGPGPEPGSINTEHLADGAVTGEKVADGSVVRNLNGLTDEVTLAAGDNVTITPTGQTLTIGAIDGLEGPQGEPGPQGPQGPPGQDGQDFTLPFDELVSTSRDTPAFKIRNEGTGPVASFWGETGESAVIIRNFGAGRALEVRGVGDKPAFSATHLGALGPGGTAGYFLGSVGIGIDFPSTELHVQGLVSGHLTTIENTNGSSNADVLELKLARGTPGSLNNYVTLRKGGNLVAGQIDGNGAGGVSYRSTGSDFAEWLPRLEGEERIEAGDIVGVFEGRISRRTASANQVMVISTAPIVLGNSPPESEEHLYEKVAFVGQAPAKVRGPVKAGDYIIASGLNDGTSVAVSAEEMTPSQHSLAVGQSWESSDEEGVKLVRAVVGLAPLLSKLAIREVGSTS